MRVSVVIPMFDGAPFVAAALDSMLAQTHPVAEVIVVDDGSEDGGARLVAEYPEPVRLLRQPHAGIGAARNRGVAAATGEAVAFVDADDRWTPTTAARHVAVLAAHPGADATCGGVAEFLDVGVDATVALRAPRTTGPVRLPGTMLVRRSSFDRVGGFDESLRRSEGIDWFARADDAGLVFVTTPGVVLERRLHGANNGIRELAGLGEYARTLKTVLDRRRAR
jgi:glycosyltransferase involved in cell wall biosynthesis